MDSWDTSVLDIIQLNMISKYESLISENSESTLTEFNDFAIGIDFSTSQSDYEIEVMKTMLTDDEKCCREFIDKIDEVLLILSTLSTSYSDVTGRTNTLMRSCEDLLEQQVCLNFNF